MTYLRKDFLQTFLYTFLISLGWRHPHLKMAFGRLYYHTLQNEVPWNGVSFKREQSTHIYQLSWDSRDSNSLGTFDALLCHTTLCWQWGVSAPEIARMLQNVTGPYTRR